MSMTGNADPGFSYRLSGKLYTLETSTCLYRGADSEGMAARYLLLTKDGRFAFIGSAIGGKAIHVAEEWGADRAKRFLTDHGEGELVEEFPEIFKKPAAVRAAAPKERKIVSRPKERPVEPSLFPLH